MKTKTNKPFPTSQKRSFLHSNKPHLNPLQGRGLFCRTSLTGLILTVCTMLLTPLLFLGEGLGVRCSGQNIGISATGATPNASAMLDISDTTKGLLIPRFTTSQRNAITSPAQSLLIFNTTTKCLEAYIDGQWYSVSCPSTCNIPDAAGSVSGTATVCQGQAGVVYTVPVVTAATGYVWTYSGTGFSIISGNNTNSITADFSAGATSGTLSVYGTNICGNGTVSPAFSVTITTSAPAVPTASAATNIAWTSFTANWTDAAGATTYYLDVATNAAFSNLVPGYNNLNVGNVTTYNVTGLITDGLVGLWHNNNNWQDASGNGYHGTAYNGATFGAAKLGSNAGSFDGVNDYVNTADFQWITIASWIYLTKADPSPTWWAGMIAQRDANSPNRNYGLYFSWNGAGALSLVFAISTDGINVVQSPKTLTPAFLNTWHHVAGTYKGSSVKLYIDGVLESSVSASGNLYNNAQVVQMGGRPAFGNYFQGSIDELAIYNRALSASEITELYNSGTGMEINNVYYYRVRAGNGCGVSGNSGTIQTQ